MRSGAWLVIVVGTWGVPSTVRAADRTPAAHVCAVLDGALALSGLLSTHLPVVLTLVLPKAVAPGADAWTCMTNRATAIASSCTRGAGPFNAPAPRTTGSTSVCCGSPRSSFTKPGICTTDPTKRRRTERNWRSSSSMGGPVWTFSTSASRAAACWPNSGTQAKGLVGVPASRLPNARRRIRPVTGPRGQAPSNHARVVCHSRVTVARDTDSATATSCSDRPPK